MTGQKKVDDKELPYFFGRNSHGIVGLGASPVKATQVGIVAIERMIAKLASVARRRDGTTLLLYGDGTTHFTSTTSRMSLGSFSGGRHELRP